MFHRFTLIPLLAVACLVGLVTSPTFAAVSAKNPAKFYGQVTHVSLNKKTSAIKGFTVNGKHHQYSYKVTSSTRFLPRSSTADVEGFGVGDYAFVKASGARAQAVEFDTTAFKPEPLENFSGTVVKTGKSGLVVVKLSDSSTRRVYRDSGTSYYVNGQPVEQPLTIHPGDSLTVYAEKHGNGHWYAVSIDEHDSSGS